MPVQNANQVRLWVPEMQVIDILQINKRWNIVYTFYVNFPGG